MATRAVAIAPSTPLIIPKASSADGAEAVILWSQQNGGGGVSIFSIINADTNAAIASGISSNIASNPSAYFTLPAGVIADPDPTLDIGGKLTGNIVTMMYRIKKNPSFLPGQTYNIIVRATSTINGAVSNSPSVSVTLPESPIVSVTVPGFIESISPATIYNVDGYLPRNFVRMVNNKVVLIFSQPLNNIALSNILMFKILDVDTNQLLSYGSVTTNVPFNVESAKINPPSALQCGFVDASTNTLWMSIHANAYLTFGSPLRIKIQTLTSPEAQAPVFSNIVTISAPVAPISTELYSVANVLPSNLISPYRPESVFIWSQTLDNGSDLSNVISYNILNASTNAVIASVAPVTNVPFSVDDWKANTYMTNTATNVAGFIDDATNKLWMLYRVQGNAAFTYGSTYSIKIRTITQPSTSIFSNTVSATMPNPPTPPPVAQLYNQNGSLPSTLIATNAAEAVFIWSQPMPNDGSSIVTYKIVSTSYSEDAPAAPKLAPIQEVGAPPIYIYDTVTCISDNTILATVSPVTDTPFNVSVWTTNNATDTTTNVAGFFDDATNTYWMLYRVKNNAAFHYHYHTIKIQSVSSNTATSNSNEVGVVLPNPPPAASLYNRAGSLNSNLISSVAAEAVFIWSQPLPTAGISGISSYSIINADTNQIIASVSPIQSSSFSAYDWLYTNSFTTDLSTTSAGFIETSTNKNHMLLRVKNNGAFTSGNTYNIAIQTTAVSGTTSISNIVVVELPASPPPPQLYNVNGSLPDNLMSPTEAEAVFIWGQQLPNASTINYIESYKILWTSGGITTLIDTISPVTNYTFNPTTWQNQSYNTNTTAMTLGFVNGSTHWMMRRVKNNDHFYGGPGVPSYNISIQTCYNNSLTSNSNIVNVALPMSADTSPVLYGVNGVLPSNLISPTDLEAVFLWSQPITTASQYSNIASYSLFNATTGEPIEVGITPIASSSSFNVNAWKTNPFTTNTTTNKLGILIGNTHWMMYRVKKDNTIDNPSFNGSNTYNIQLETLYKDNTPNGLSNSVSVTLPKQPIAPSTLYGLTGVTAIQIDPTIETLSVTDFVGESIHNPVSISNKAALKRGRALFAGRIINIYAPDPTFPIVSYYFTNELTLPFVNRFMINRMLREPGRLVNGKYVLYEDNPDMPYIFAPRLYWRKCNSFNEYIELPQSPKNINNIPGSVLYIANDVPDHEPTLPSPNIVYDNYAYINANRIGVGSLPTIAPLITAGLVAAGQGMSVALPLCLRRFYNDEEESPALVKFAPGVYLTEDGTKVGLLSPYNYILDGRMRLILPINFTQVKPNIFNQIPLGYITLPPVEITHEGMHIPSAYYRNGSPLAVYTDVNLPGGGRDLGVNPGEEPALDTISLPPCYITYYKGYYTFKDDRIILKSISGLTVTETSPILELVDVGYNYTDTDSFANIFPDGNKFTYGGITYINNSNSTPQIFSINKPVVNLFASFMFSERMFQNNTTITNIGVFTYNGAPTNASAPAHVFSGCTNLISIDKDFNFKNIGANAFNGCSSFVGNNNGTLSLSSTSGMTIGTSAFNACTALSRVTITVAGDLTISQNAFNGCTALTHITLNITGNMTISPSAFSGCTGLQSVAVNAKQLNSLDELISQFSGYIKSVSITLLDTSGGYAFTICPLPSIMTLILNIPKLTLNKSAGALFNGLTSLEVINISTVEQIGGNPGAVQLFNNCPNIRDLYFISTYAANHTISTDSYTYLTRAVLSVPNLVVNSGTFSDSSMNVFSLNMKCWNVNNTIDIDAELAGSRLGLRELSLVSLDPLTFTSKLSNFKQLRSVTISTPSVSIPSGSFLVETTDISDSKLSYMNVHRSVIVSMSDEINRLTNLKTLIVTKVSYNYLSVLSLLPVSLDSLTVLFDSDVVSIDSNIRTMMTNFVGIQCELSFNPSSPTTVYNISLEDILKIRNCKITGNIKFLNIEDPTYLSTFVAPPPRILHAADWTKRQYAMFDIVRGGIAININGNVDISDNAFENVVTLRSVVVNGRSTIGKRAFYNASKLTSISLLGDSVIDDEAFIGTQLQTVALSGFTHIGDYAFKNVSTLKEVTSPDLIVSIFEGAFFGCTQLQSVPLREGMVSIYDYAFVNSGISGEIVIPYTALVFDHVFVGCNNITKLIYKCEALDFKDPTQLHDNFLDSLDDISDGIATLYIDGEATITPLSNDGICDIQYQNGTTFGRQSIPENQYYDYTRPELYTSRINKIRQMKSSLTILLEALTSSIRLGKISITEMAKRAQAGQELNAVPQVFSSVNIKHMEDMIPITEELITLSNDLDYASEEKLQLELDFNDISGLSSYNSPDTPTGPSATLLKLESRYKWAFENMYGGGVLNGLLPLSYAEETKDDPSRILDWFRTIAQNIRDPCPNYSGMALSVQYCIGHWQDPGFMTNGFYEKNIEYLTDMRLDLKRIVNNANAIVDLYHDIVNINNLMPFVGGILPSQLLKLPKPYTISANNLRLYVVSNNLRINDLGVDLEDFTDASGYIIRESSAYIEIGIGDVPYIVYRGQEINFHLSDASGNKLTEISVNGILRRDISEQVSYHRACVLEWMYNYALFNTIRFGIDYTFEGIATHIKSMCGLVGSHIVINSPITIISEAAMTDCTECIIDISSSGLTLENNCFNRLQDSSMNIITDDSILMIGQELFDGGGNIYISSNIPMINSMVPSSDTTTNRSLNRTVTSAGVGDISIQKLENKTLAELIPYLANLYDVSMQEITNIKMVNMFNTSSDSISSIHNPLYYISCVISSTLQEKIVIAEPRDWFWCFPINQDVIFESGHTTAHYGQSYLGIKEPAMLVGPHTYRVIPESFNGRDVGYKNNFAPTFFTVNGIKFARDFTRTDVAVKHSTRNNRDEPGGDIELYLFASQRKDAKQAAAGTLLMFIFDVVSTVVDVLSFGYTIYMKRVAIAVKFLAAVSKTSRFFKGVNMKIGKWLKGLVSVLKGTSKPVSGQTKTVAKLGSRTRYIEAGNPTSLLDNPSHVAALTNKNITVLNITDDDFKFVINNVASNARQSLKRSSLQASPRSFRNAIPSMVKQFSGQPMAIQNRSIYSIKASTQSKMRTLLKGSNAEAVPLTKEIALEITTGSDDIIAEQAINMTKDVIKREKFTKSKIFIQKQVFGKKQGINVISAEQPKKAIEVKTFFNEKLQGQIKEQYQQVRWARRRALEKSIAHKRILAPIAKQEKALKKINFGYYGGKTKKTYVSELTDIAHMKFHDKAVNSRVIAEKFLDPDNLRNTFSKAHPKPNLNAPEDVIAKYDADVNKFISDVNEKWRNSGADDISIPRESDELLKFFKGGAGEYKGEALETYIDKMNLSLKKLGKKQENIIKDFIKSIDPEVNIDNLIKPIGRVALPGNPLKLSTKLLMTFAISTSIKIAVNIVRATVNFTGDTVSGNTYDKIFKDTSLPYAKLSEIADKIRMDEAFTLFVDDDDEFIGVSGEIITRTIGPSGETIFRGVSDEIIVTLDDGDDDTMKYIVSDPYQIIDKLRTVFAPTYVPTESVYNKHDEAFDPLDLSYYIPSTTRYQLDASMLNDEGHLPATQSIPSPLFMRAGVGNYLELPYQWSEIWMAAAGTMLYPDLGSFYTFLDLNTTGDKILPVLKFDEVNSFYLATRPVSYHIHVEPTSATRDINSPTPITNKVYGGATGVTIDLSNRTSIEPNEFCNGPSGIAPYSVNKVIIPSTVTSIGENAFYDAGLTSVEFTQNERGTRDITPLTIGAGAFFGNSGLREITLPSNVGALEAGAFDGCSGINSVTFTGPVPEIIDQSVLDILNNIDNVFIPPEHIEEYSNILDTNIIANLPDAETTMHLYNLEFVNSLQNNSTPPNNIYVSWTPAGAINGNTELYSTNLTKTILDEDDAAQYVFTRVQMTDGVIIPDEISEATADGAQYKTGWICTYSASGIIPNF